MDTTQDSSSPKPPAVFVSYSWCGDKHQTWVANLARRLRANGVDVHLDLWDVSLGHDLNLFMEQYAAPSARVLVVLSDDYAEKADGRGERPSGVGTETTIVSPTVYEDLGGNRVIPVIPASGAVATQPLVPRYLKGRNWIDFRSDYEDAYERLLRELHGVPLEPAPPLGPELPRLAFWRPDLSCGVLTVPSIRWSIAPRAPNRRRASASCRVAAPDRAAPPAARAAVAAAPCPGGQ